MASRTGKDVRFRGGGRIANSFATDHENGGDKATGAVGAIFAAGLLRTSFILLRRSHADGQCVDAERMAAIHPDWRHIYSDVNNGEDFLQERSQERTARTNTNIFRTRSSTRNSLEGGDRTAIRFASTLEARESITTN